jgi:hypothetical protein
VPLLVLIIMFKSVAAPPVAQQEELLLTFLPYQPQVAAKAVQDHHHLRQPLVALVVVRDLMTTAIVESLGPQEHQTKDLLVAKAVRQTEQEMALELVAAVVLAA